MSAEATDSAPTDLPSTAASPAGHSTYASLVDSPTDMIGHVAYALYKRDKLLFCEAIRTAKGRDPVPAEVDTFITSTTVRYGAYKNEATELLGTFATEAMQSQLDQEAARLEATYSAKLATEKASFEARLEKRDSIGRSLLHGILGNVATLALTALFVGILILAEQDGFAKLMRLVGFERAPQEQSAPPAPLPAPRSP